MLFFDPLYLVFAIPGLLLALLAQAKVKSAYARASKILSSSGYSGADVAHAILRAKDISGVRVEPTQGLLTDHYDPIGKKLRLSESNYYGDSLAALGVSAHEVGHAIQHKTGYLPMMLRHFICPVAALGTNLAVIMFPIGLIFSTGPGSFGDLLMLLAIALFSGFFIFTVVTLPVEFNASRRALQVLQERGIVTTAEIKPIKEVLDAAALTYVAAAVQALMILLYFVFRYLASRE